MIFRNQDIGQPLGTQFAKHLRDHTTIADRENVSQVHGGTPSASTLRKVIDCKQALTEMSAPALYTLSLLAAQHAISTTAQSGQSADYILEELDMVAEELEFELPEPLYKWLSAYTQTKKKTKHQ